MSMGRHKDMIEQGYDYGIKTRVCRDCIDEDGIQTFIVENSDDDDSMCSYCCIDDVETCGMGRVIGYIHECISTEWTEPANELPYESREGGWQGEVLTTIELLFQLGIEIDDETIIDDIVNSLYQSHWSKAGYFSPTPDQTMIYSWESFCRFVINKSRYFFLNAQNESFDSHQLGGMNPVKILNEVSLMVINLNMFLELPVSQVIKRVRIVDDYQEASTASTLGTPPLEFCTMANRMSPAGIPMFYGAYNLETSIRETFDPELSRTKKAVVGNFYPCRALLLIDLRMKFKFPSIFDKDKSFRFEKKFLLDFIEDFSKPIKRTDEAHITYVPTQIVTEYFRYILSKEANRRIDGVIYPSSKNKGDDAIVIFAENEQCVDKGVSSKYVEEVLFLDSYEAVDLTPFC